MSLTRREDTPLDSLTVPASLDSLALIGQYVKAAAADAGASKEAAFRLRGAVDEIATNIITHGYAGFTVPGTIDVRAVRDSGTLRITLEDTGVAFDPRQVPPPAGPPSARRRAKARWIGDLPGPASSR
jgi:anti-sigma regulatory factor (Ser/Thr protein kinase)